MYYVYVCIMSVCLSVCMSITPPSFLDRFSSNRFQFFQLFPGGSVLFRIFYFVPWRGPLINLTNFTGFFRISSPTHFPMFQIDFISLPKNVEEFKADKKCSVTFLPTVYDFT